MYIYIIKLIDNEMIINVSSNLIAYLRGNARYPLHHIRL